MVDFQFLSRCCSREFRAGMLDIFPALKESRSLRALTAYLLWATPLADSTILLPRDVLKACVGVKGNNRFNGTNLINEFSERVAFLEVVSILDENTGELLDYSFANRQARVVRVCWPEDALDLFAIERSRSLSERRIVRFVDGTAYTKNTRTEIRRAELALAAEGRPAKTAEMQLIADGMNNLPAAPFNKLQERCSEVETLMRAELEGEVLASQLDTLMGIYTQPQPFYQGAEHSTRLYEMGRGLTYIKREYRAALTRGWVEFDLVASQLCAAAYIWDVPSLIEIFENKSLKVWAVFLEALGEDVNDKAVKNALKPGVYGLCYGAGRDTIIETIIKEGGTDELAERFLELPWMVDLLEARKRRMDEITEAWKAGQPVTTVAGEIIRGGKPQSALSRQMQAIEAAVVAKPGIIALEAGVLRLWQHDGYSVDFTGLTEEEQAELTERMSTAVIEAGERFGIRARLEHKRVA